MKLPPLLDLAAAAPLRSELIQLRGQPIEIDASEVERLGAPCLQVLLSAQATWNGDRQPFRIAGPSAEFMRALKLMAAETLVIEESVR